MSTSGYNIAQLLPQKVCTIYQYTCVCTHKVCINKKKKDNSCNNLIRQIRAMIDYLEFCINYSLILMKSVCMIMKGFFFIYVYIHVINNLLLIINNNALYFK